MGKARLDGLGMDAGMLVWVCGARSRIQFRLDEVAHPGVCHWDLSGAKKKSKKKKKKKQKDDGAEEAEDHLSTMDTATASLDRHERDLVSTVFCKGSTLRTYTGATLDKMCLCTCFLDLGPSNHRVRSSFADRLLQLS